MNWLKTLFGIETPVKDSEFNDTIQEMHQYIATHQQFLQNQMSQQIYGHFPIIPINPYDVQKFHKEMNILVYDPDRHSIFSHMLTPRYKILEYEE